jgi:hypothetical protein
VPPNGTFQQLSMDPARQTPRWRALRDLVHGGRLHLGPGQEQLLQQLSMLKATQLPSGALRVEGRRDDLADALALAAPIALKLPPTGSPDGTVQFVGGSLTWGEDGLSASGGRFVRVRPDGRTELAETPRWDPYFDLYAQEMIAQGVRTPAIIEWEKEQQAGGGSAGLNVPIGDY